MQILRFMRTVTLAGFLHPRTMFESEIFPTSPGATRSRSGTKTQGLSARVKRMMPVIRVSDETWERMKSHARPFEDKPEDVVNLALDALDKKLGRHKPAPKRLAREPHLKLEKTPQKEFREPLMRELYKLGGSAEVSQIRRVMKEALAGRLKEGDLQLVSTGDPRWWNAICWERAELVRAGLFVDDGKRGVWKLSDRGKKMAGTY
jgi:hypothetical protein